MALACPVQNIGFFSYLFIKFIKLNGFLMKDSLKRKDSMGANTKLDSKRLPFYHVTFFDMHQSVDELDHIELHL